MIRFFWLNVFKHSEKNRLLLAVVTIVISSASDCRSRVCQGVAMITPKGGLPFCNMSTAEKPLVIKINKSNRLLEDA